MFQPNLYSTNLVKSSILSMLCSYKPFHSFTLLLSIFLSFTICLSDRQCLYPYPCPMSIRLIVIPIVYFVQPSYSKSNVRLTVFSSSHFSVSMQSKAVHTFYIMHKTSYDDTMICSFIFFSRLHFGYNDSFACSKFAFYEKSQWAFFKMYL